MVVFDILVVYWSQSTYLLYSGYSVLGSVIIHWFKSHSHHLGISSTSQVNSAWPSFWEDKMGTSRSWGVTSMPCNVPRPTQPSIPPGSVNEDQLQLGRKRQVWFILLAYEHGVCR